MLKSFESFRARNSRGQILKRTRFCSKKKKKSKKKVTHGLGFLFPTQLEILQGKTDDVHHVGVDSKTSFKYRPTQHITFLPLLDSTNDDKK